MYKAWLTEDDDDRMIPLPIFEYYCVSKHLEFMLFEGFDG